MDQKKRIKIARRFSEKLLKKYRKFITSIILAGSSARSDFGLGSDIDILVVINDTVERFDEELQRKIENDIFRIAHSIPEARKEVTNPITGEVVKTTILDAPL
ncbi:nucleotidyltransferase family protein [Thermococcus sp.]